MNEIGLGMLAVRIVAHLVTMVYVVKWYDPEATHRPGVSWLAVAIAGGSFSAATLALLTEQAALPQFPLCVLAVSLSVLVVRAGGNVAKLLPRRTWTHRP